MQHWDDRKRLWFWRVEIVRLNFARKVCNDKKFFMDENSSVYSLYTTPPFTLFWKNKYNNEWGDASQNFMEASFKCKWAMGWDCDGQVYAKESPLTIKAYV